MARRELSVAGRSFALDTVRSERKTVALRLRPDGTVELRVPRRMTEAEIDRFLADRRAWLEKHLSALDERRQRRESAEKLSEAELRDLAERAARVIPERVRYYAPLVGVDYAHIAIRAQRSRWGSCSAKGSLSFNCLLLLAPPEVLDSVVVHELCHRLEMNHSARFYAEVLRVFPAYRQWHGWLKENGRGLMDRLP